MMLKEEFYHFLEGTGGLIHPNRKLPAPISLFGIECDDGWLELIAQLIQELIDAGWTRETLQIKEKSGGLCFYANGLPQNGREIIAKYENRSYEICERCGSTDKVTLCGDSWVKTLCGQCAPPWLERH
jgi:hypothetical protein